MDLKTVLANESIQEDIEKHDELNPVLFSDNKLKPEVKDKAIEVATELLAIMEENGLSIKLKDLILTGSNASYNYTKDSDIDLHLVADMTNITDQKELYTILFNSFKSAFNRKYEITFYDIPVEVYIESDDTALVSNGIYSIYHDAWIKEPEKEEIPEVDKQQIDDTLQPWLDRYTQLVTELEQDETLTETKIDEFLNDLYELRANGLKNGEGSEYSNENLVFKEFRNLGYLDKLKELRDKVISRRLSLEERLENRVYRQKLYDKLYQLAHYQPILHENGIFEFYNVPEMEVQTILNALKQQDFVAYAQASSDKLDFSRLAIGGRPSRLFHIHGKIAEKEYF